TTLFRSLRHECEDVRMPARSKRKSDAAAGKLVDHRPVFSNAQWIVQRENDATRTQRNAARDRGERGGRYSRVGIRPAELVEVALRRPHRAEVVGISELGAFQQEAIGATRTCAALTGGEVEQAEVHRFLKRADRRCAG